MKNIKIKNLVLKAATFFAVAASFSGLKGVDGSNVVFAMENNNIDNNKNPIENNGTYSSVDSNLYGYFEKKQPFDFDSVAICAQKVNKAVNETFSSAKRIVEKMKERGKYEQFKNEIRGGFGGSKNKALLLPIFRNLDLVNRYMKEMIKVVEKSGFYGYVDKLCEIENKGSDEVYLREYGKLKDKVLEIARIMFAGFDVQRGLKAPYPNFLRIGGFADLIEDLKDEISRDSVIDELSVYGELIERKLKKLYRKFFVYGVLGAEQSEVNNL